MEEFVHLATIACKVQLIQLHAQQESIWRLQACMKKHLVLIALLDLLVKAVVAPLLQLHAQQVITAQLVLIAQLHLFTLPKQDIILLQGQPNN
jgi:hypothetical protein